MGKWKKGLLAAVLCAAVLAGIAVPASGSSSASNVYLMAVNERVLDTTPANMPTVVGGVLYVPYTMLSRLDSGIDLGVSSLYSNTRRTVLVTDGQRGVVFDTRTNTAQDLTGKSLATRAVTRNAMVFLPIDWLCQYFGTISCTRTSTRFGTVVRVTNSAAILRDRDFVDAAESLLAESLQNYLAAGGGGDTGPTPSSGVQTTSPPSGAELYLACRCGDEAAECAALLEGQGRRALFLFTCEELRTRDDLVRRLVGAGHTVGLALTGADAERCLEEAALGRELLAAAARYNALVASAPNLGGADREALEAAGFVLWSTTVRGEDFSSGAALVRGLSTRRVNFVEITCGGGGRAFLRDALSAMQNDNCQIYQATAPALA